MKRIASFCVDHDVLERGMYISRIDGNIVTYDIRFIKPNTPPFLENGAIHTIEHLFATMARNSEWENQIVYFGPMGCRTGFYFLVRDMEHREALKLTQRIIGGIARYQGEIPGVSSKECGNFREHDLPGAIQSCKEMEEVLQNWSVKQMEYIK